MLNRMLRMLQRLDDGIAFLEKSALGTGILAMAALSIANVLMRNLFDASLVFAGEINQVLIIFVTFAGVGYAARQGRHIRMTAIYDQLSNPARRVLMTFIALSTAALLLALAWYALQYVLHVKAVHAVTPALQIPLYFVYAIVPLGFVLGAIQYLLTAVRNITANEPYISFTHKDEYDVLDDDPAAQQI